MYSRDNFYEYKPSLVKFYDNDLPERDQNDNRQRTLNASMNASAQMGAHQRPFGHHASSLPTISEPTKRCTMPVPTCRDTTPHEPAGISRRSGVFNLNWASVSRINFDRSFGKHRVGALAGIEFKHEEHRNLNVSGYDFINDQIKEVAYVPSANVSGSSNTNYSRSLSYLGREPPTPTTTVITQR
ncbi:MAG: hypothetical protein ACLUNS_10310 [Alistipes shahii]